MSKATKYSDEGVIAHALAAMCLTEGTDAAAYIGRLIEAEDYEHAKLSPSSAKRWLTCAGSHALIQRTKAEFEPRFFSMEVTEEMAEGVQCYLDMVRSRIAQRELEGAISVKLLIEQSLPIDHMTGEENATGTGDVLIVSVFDDGSAMLDVVDLKFGMGVEVIVENNEQLLMYGSGALRNLDLIYDINRVCLTVHQPRIKVEPSDWEIDADVVYEFERAVPFKAKHAIHILAEISDDKLPPYLQPGDHCRTTFCDARAVCPKLREFVVEAVFAQEVETAADFENLDVHTTVAETAAIMDGTGSAADWLSAVMDKADIIEDFCKQVRAEVERRLLAGKAVPRWKLVQGRKGNRAFSNKGTVEELLKKTFRLKSEEIYDHTLKGVPAIEKLLSDQPKRWAKVLPLITQSEGKPSVAPESDKRPALVITPPEDDFENLERLEGEHVEVLAGEENDLVG